MQNLNRYRAWLVDKGYKTSTIDATLRHLRVVVDNPEDVGYRATHVKRYLLYVSLTKRNPLGQRFTEHMTTGHGLEAVADTTKGGGNIKALLDNGQWYQLRQTLRRGDNLDKLLLAYMESPYRISEFLELSVKAVDKDTIQHAWSRNWIAKTFINPRDKQLYQILCPSAQCAYSRMRRRLSVVADKLGFSADLNTLYKTFHKRAEA